jgi:hypothetical protein
MAARLRKWSIEERDTALLTLAACGGNSAKASAMLKQQGIGIQPRTLRKWRESQFAEHYIELAAGHGRAIEKVAEVKMRETILQAQDVQMQGLEAAAEQLKTGEARDPSAVARNAAVVGGIGLQHLLPYTGRPSAIVQHDSAEAILKRLQQKHPGCSSRARPKRSL